MSLNGKNRYFSLLIINCPPLVLSVRNLGKYQKVTKPPETNQSSKQYNT